MVSIAADLSLVNAPLILYDTDCLPTNMDLLLPSTYMDLLLLTNETTCEVHCHLASPPLLSDLMKLGACCKGNEGHTILNLMALPPKKSRLAPFKSAWMESTLDRQLQGTTNSGSSEVWLKLKSSR